MEIGLIDVDSHNYPNLALMKISAYEKSQGNQVEWWNGLFHYDKVYQAKVFDETYSKEFNWCINADEIIKGGTGYDLDNKLPDHIEHIYPDYSIYPELTKDTAYGFLTRGCPRHCAFCIVGDKEGLKSHQVAELSEFWRGQKSIEILDPNITASKECLKLFKELAETESWVNFNQGIDIRFMDEEKAALLNQIKTSMIHFAWDNYEFNTYEKLKKFRPLFTKDVRRLTVYVLTNFNTTHEQDLERIYKLRELNYDPYVMIYDKPNAPRETRLLQRWVNNKRIFRSCRNFNDYDPKKG